MIIYDASSSYDDECLLFVCEICFTQTSYTVSAVCYEINVDSYSIQSSSALESSAFWLNTMVWSFTFSLEFDLLTGQWQQLVSEMKLKNCVTNKEKREKQNYKFGAVPLPSFLITMLPRIITFLIMQILFEWFDGKLYHHKANSSHFPTNIKI